MKKTFNQYLIDNKALNADQQTKDRLWHEFRRVYDREHKKLTRAKKKKVEIYFLKQEFLELEQHANLLGISIADYIRKAIVATMNDCYIIPSKEVLQDIVIAIKGVHGQLSNIAHVALHKGHVSKEDFNKAREILFQLENKLFVVFEPLALDKWIEQQVAENPDFLKLLEASIDNYKNGLLCS